MSTAKSMAAQYKQRTSSQNNRLLATSGHQQNQRAFKSSTSNLLHSSGASLLPTANEDKQQRLKATSMTNLLMGPGEANSKSGEPQSGRNSSTGTRLQRPVSRSALDSIHNGMNAKYAQVQSKVLLQNIRPKQPTCSSPTNQKKATATATTTATASTKSKKASTLGQLQAARLKSQPGAQNERSQLAAKMKMLEEQLEEADAERKQLRGELEREKTDKLEELKELRRELEQKTSEHERQQEEYHQKLLEAYELADQNRRAADNVLSESRQRDEQSRKKIEELESQLAELKEFVSMKEEMTSKMGELREQIRQEREHYEEKTRSLSQMFESEKMSRLPVDQNSNYFRRIKDPLESMDSVNRLDQWPSAEQEQAFQGGANGKLRGQVKRNKRSTNQLEHDNQMYGSKLSTRMQDTARSAWKASRKFASSVITGGLVGGGFSACTKRASRDSSSAPRRNSVSGSCGIQATATSGEAVQRQPVAMGADDACGEQHTSVVEVGLKKHDVGVHVEDTSGCNESCRAHELDGGAKMGPCENGMVKVDENHKLTIVTKFNQLAEHEAPSDSEQQQADDNDDRERFLQSEQAHCCGGSSERSRCASSSSGRGTASQPESDSSVCRTESSSSPSGSEQPMCVVLPSEEKGPNFGCPQEEASNCNEIGSGPKQTGVQPISPTISNSSSGCSASSSSNEHNYKSHKRRSSIFKTSRVFSGSQASLNKLRSFFAAASSTAQQNGAERRNKSFDQATTLATISTTNANSFSLNGQALEDLLRKSGQGGAVLSREEIIDRDKCANSVDKQTDEIWKKCQDRAEKQSRQAAEPETEMETKKADCKPQVMAVVEQPIALKTS